MALRPAKTRQSSTAPVRSSSAPERQVTGSVLEKLSGQAQQSGELGPVQALQNMVGTSPVVATQLRLQSASAAAGPALQRQAIMPYETWISSSFKAHKNRTDKLLEVDIALIKYHAAITKTVFDQKVALGALISAITAWIASKPTKTVRGKVVTKSIRAGVMLELKAQAVAKNAELSEVPNDAPQSKGQRTNFSFDVYNRVRMRVQSILSVPSAGIDAGTRVTMVKRLDGLREQTRSIDINHGPVTAIWDACSILIAIGEMHLDVEVAAKSKPGKRPEKRDPLKRYQARFERHYQAAMAQIARQDQGGHTVSPKVTEHLEMVKRDVDIYTKLLAPAAPESPDFSFADGYDEAVDLTGEALNALGMQGTGGKGNEGLEDYWKTDLANTDAKQHTATIMSGLHDASAPSAMDKLSGGSDMAAGGVMAMALGAELGRLWNVISYCNEQLRKNKRGTDTSALTKKRNWAIARIALLSTVRTTEALGKTLGGAFTALRGHGLTHASTFFAEQAPDSGPRNSDRGIDISTDFKLVGDSATVVLSAVNSVKSIVDIFKNFGKRFGKVKGHSKSGVDHMESTFDTLHDVSGAAKNVGGAFSAVRKLYDQIAGGGQVAAQNVGAATNAARGVVNGAPLIPILGLIKGVLDFIKHGIKLARTGTAAYQSKTMSAKLLKGATQPLYNAFIVTKEKFTKQIKRAVIDLIHAAGSITSGALNVSGLGAGIGAVIGMASTVAQLMQIGIRKFKQFKRDQRGGTQTNLEQAAEKDGFVSHALEVAESRLADDGLHSGFLNKDKTTANKEFRYRQAAIEILRAPLADQKWFYDALNISRDVQRVMNNDKLENKEQSILPLIINSLKAR